MAHWCGRVVFCVCVCLSGFLTGAVLADSPGAWNLPRFTAEAQKVNEAAGSVSVKPGTDVVVLDEEDAYVFDADGKSVHTHYLTYKVLTQKGAEGWDAIGIAWEPWREEHPEVRARVITPDNTVHPLDPKTITDTPARDEDEKTYGDGRVLRAPLPAIAPGSVVEEEEVSKETAPFFGAGVVVQSYFGRMVPSQQLKLTIDAPTSLPVKYSLRLLPEIKPQKTELNGRTQIVFERGPFDALDKAEDYLPGDTPAQPQITFSTGASWQAMAEGYSKIVDEKALPKEVEGLVSRLLSGRTTREEKAAEVLQYLSKEIRYTGVEFGDAAIIPHPPAETLKHRYGDCKDKATLAVAMLRAAGIPAYVALLNTGNRLDVDPDLPGMGLFDHAIVYAPGNPDLWMDPTDERARLGQLPNTDQGRLALVARPDSTRLVPTPEASSQENSIIEKRDFFLAENGPARVVETTEPRGTFEGEFRAAYLDADDKDSRKNLKDYIANEYLSEKLTRMERSDPRDLHKPFELVIEASAAKRGATDLESAVAAIRLESLFYRLPNELQQQEKEADKSADKTKDKPRKPRVTDFLLPEAYSYEWQYRIVPPLGFQAKPLPANSKMQLGPATLSEEFATGSDGVVRVTMKFDTVKRRYTAAEARELREKVSQIREGPAVFIYFEPTAQALMNQGRIKEAFQATRNLIARHPKEAVHHLQRAKMLLAGGMGLAARDEARAAVKLEPNSALAQKMLAEILEYDLVGRQYRRGSDFAGAEEAFRSAERLDPDDKATVANLAILLEHNPWGLRYGPGAKLKDAISEYRKLTVEERANLGIQNNLAFALFYAGDFREAQKNAEGLNPQPIALIVASVAGTNGAQVGIEEARKRTVSEELFKQVARAAGQMMANLRMYSVAADLMEAGTSGDQAADTGADAVMFRKTKPREQMSFRDDPIGTAMRFYLLQLNADLTSEQLLPFCSRNGKIALGTPEWIEGVRKGERGTLNSKARAGMFPDIGADLSVTRAQPNIEGNDESGYKVTLWPAATYKSATYVVKEDGRYKVLAISERPAGIGLEALDRLAAHDLTGVRILLDWLREDQHLVVGDDPLSGAPFPRLWTKGKQADDRAVKLAAAAILLRFKETAARGVAVLEEARNSTSDDIEKLNIDLALLVGYYTLEESQKELALSAKLAKQYPESQRIFLDESFELRVLGRLEEAEDLAEGRLKRFPGDLDAMRELAWNAITREDYPAARTLNQKILDMGKAETRELNAIAWLSLFTGKVTGSDVENALKAAQLSRNSPSILHTLGCAYAEIGKTKEAREVLLQAMDSLNLDEPDDNYWYAFGRIAEQYGEYDTARSDYTRVAKPKRPIDIHDSSYRLAQMHLNAIANALNNAPIVAEH